MSDVYNYYEPIPIPDPVNEDWVLFFRLIIF